MHGPSLIASRLAIGLFVLVLGLPVVTAVPVLLGSGDDIAAREQRRKSPWPPAPESLQRLKTWPRRFSSWFDDRFGLRDVLIDMHNYGKAALGISPSKRAILGRDGWIFVDNAHLTEANRGAYPFAPGEAAGLAGLFTGIQERLAERGVAYVHLTPPDKQSLFREKLPARIHSVGLSRYQEWRSAARDSRLNFVDVYPALAAAIAAGDTPYMQTDSHWNCRGAYLAYREIMEHLNRGRPKALPVLTEDEVRFELREDPRGGDLVRNSLGTPYLFPEKQAMRCVIAGGAPNLSYSALRTGEKLTLLQTYRAERPSRVVNHDFPEGPRVLVMRDSYTNAMIRFLNRSFGEVIFMAHMAKPLDEALIDEVDPDLVIYEHIERTLTRFGNFVPIDALPPSQPR